MLYCLFISLLCNTNLTQGILFQFTEISKLPFLFFKFTCSQDFRQFKSSRHKTVMHSEHLIEDRLN